MKGQDLSQQLLRNLSEVEQQLMQQTPPSEFRIDTPTESETEQQQASASSTDIPFKPTSKAYMKMDDITNQQERKAPYKHMIYYNNDMNCWRCGDVSENDLKMI